ncbi:MFS transporter [Caldisalinibacter kiritimatiensis]|uniref:Putative sodium:galactoside symporter protein n=1 Tax=Caldisalinibacter kiritimatiensis TaxID=1304284 RepID=R1AU90_9FIRM|nr:MFS transporter [Caldisalinibacter kiritimatiensis]EOD00733.1 putative sodium:galactoside symporter protein [Caldisalinibacter kiritimatiensis]
MTIKTEQKLKIHQKILFGIGDLAGCLSNTIIGFFYLFYLTDVVGLRPAYAGAAILLGRIWDAITDPLIGNISDRTNSRWGRRRVFLLFGSIPLGLTFFLLWTVSKNWTQFEMFIYTTITYIIHMTALTSVMVPYQTLTAEMTNDYDERTSLTAYRMLFSILGGLVGVIVPKLIVDGYSSDIKGFLIMGIVFGISVGLAPLFPFLGGRERGKPIKSSFSVKKDIKTIWENKPFRFILLMFLMTWTAINLLEAMFMYFFKYWLKLDNQFEIIVGLIFIVAAIFIPFWVKVSKHQGKRRAYILGIGFFGICIIGITFIQPGMLVTTFIMASLIGIGVSAAHVIPHSIIPDSIDYGQVQTGEQREGMYYGVLTFLQKVGTASAIGISGMVLDYVGYIPDTVQSSQVLWTIRILLGPIPGIFLLIGIICIYFYPIDRNMFQEMILEMETSKGEA